LAPLCKEDHPLRAIDRPIWNQDMVLTYEDYLLHQAALEFGREMDATKLRAVQESVTKLFKEFSEGASIQMETFILVAQKEWGPI
jgi:hypothetical protein